jgi:7-cyano-7-deazaguanine synthase
MSEPHLPAWSSARTSASPLAVLVSGGLDSAILLGESLGRYPAVHPIYVRVGSLWEDTEFDHLTRFLNAIRTPNLKACVVLHQPVADVYDSHWSLTGKNVPDANSPDEAVFLPGRNVLLLAKPLIWCHLHGIPEIATAPLVGNPFPDATTHFYTDFARVVSEGIAGHVRVLRPYADLGFHKVDVLRRGAKMPLQFTFSCIQPQRGLHCGECNKCAERQGGFREAKMPDPTRYAASATEAR